MSSFFDAPPPPVPPLGRPWAGRREAAVIGKTVALNLVIGRSDKAALWIPALTASAEGFEFDLELRHDLEDEEFEFGDPFFFGHHHRRRRRTSEDGFDPDLLRFGIQFSDGRKATNIERRHPPRTPGADEPPEGPVLMPRGGGGGEGRWRQDYWVSPLPPVGPLAFVCEWPIAAIAETRNEIDSALVREAAAAAVLLWSATEAQGDTGSWTTYGRQRVVLTPDPSEPPDPDSTG